MAELKTKATTIRAEAFLATVEPEQKRLDSLELLKIFQEITGEKPVMWGTAIVGFGSYHYESTRSAQKGDWPLVGFSPRKQNITLYVMQGNAEKTELLEKLGKHKRSSGCLYINRLADVDRDILKQLISDAFAYMKSHT